MTKSYNFIFVMYRMVEIISSSQLWIRVARVCRLEMAPLFKKYFEMGLLWLKMNCLKSAVLLFFKLDTIGPCSELLNEVLCIAVVQGAADYLTSNMKVWKKQDSNLGHTGKVRIKPRGKSFFRPPTLILCCFAVSWPTRLHRYCHL